MRRIGLFAIAMLFACAGRGLAAEPSTSETAPQQLIVSLERIWDRPGHAAFTDVLLHDGALYCSFREGSGHVPGDDGLNGVVRVLRSRDRQNWESIALLAEEHIDLRDPKLSLTPDGRVMINCGASTYHGKVRLKVESRVAFSDTNGENFSAPVRVELPKAIVTGSDWLWRITWYDGVAWGAVQQVPPGQPRLLQLVKSNDGVHYEHVSQVPVDAPSETTLRFTSDGTLLAMIRGEGNPKIGSVGRAKAPYTDWQITTSNKRFGGPNFVQLTGHPGADDAWLAGSRAYDTNPHTTRLWWLDIATAECRELLKLPSAGDNSYPGFAIDRERGLVYVSYYSSHEGKAAIYLVTLRLAALEQFAKR